jgi:hypothetical protein
MDIIHPYLEERTSLWGFTSSCSLYMWLDHFYFIVVLELVKFTFIRLDLRNYMRYYYFIVKEEIASSI